MDPDEGGPKSNRNTSNVSHLYHKYRNYLQVFFNLFLLEQALILLFVKYYLNVFFYTFL